MSNKHNHIFLDAFAIGGVNIADGIWVVFFIQYCNACNHSREYSIRIFDSHFL